METGLEQELQMEKQPLVVVVVLLRHTRRISHLKVGTC